MTKEQQQKLCQECQAPIDHDDPYRFCMKCRELYGKQKHEEDRQEMIDYVNGLSDDQKYRVGLMLHWRAVVDTIADCNGNWDIAMPKLNKLMTKHFYRQYKKADKAKRQEMHRKADERKQNMCDAVVDALITIGRARYGELVEYIQTSYRDVLGRPVSKRTIQRWISTALKLKAIQHDLDSRTYSVLGEE